MIPYASNTHGARNLTTLRDANWRILISPGRSCEPPKGFLFAIDNGAWPAHRSQTPFDGEAFAAIVEKHGGAADFVVIPDIVSGGRDSFEFSLSWIDRLKHLRLILFAVQDNMNPKDVGAVLERYPNMGIFLGGTTEYKLKEMHGWGMVAHAMRRYYHVGRVNSMRRIKLCAECGADSFDGTSATIYSKSLPRLERARRQRPLFSVRRQS